MIVQSEIEGDITTVLHYDEGQEKFHVERIQDTEVYVEQARVASEYWNSDARKGHEMYYAGSIPNIVVEKFCNEERITFRDFITNPEHCRRLLNNPDYSYLRVWKGKV
jgi:hypothetical protein